MLFERLHIATLIACLAGPPLIGFSVESGLSTWSYYRADAEFAKVLAGQKLAFAGVELAHALPSEALAPPDRRAASRRDTDRAFDGVAAAYANWRRLERDDETVQRDMGLLASKRAQLAEYRQQVDSKAANATDAPEVVALVLQVMLPASGAGLDLVRRLSEKVDDLAISRYLTGLHALLQFNDGTMASIRPGAVLLSAGELPPQTHAIALRGDNLRRIYGPALRELLPAGLVAAHDAFENGPEGQFRARVESALAEGRRGDLSPEATGRWLQASQARAGLNQKLIAQASEGLEKLTQTRKAELHRAFLASAGVSIAGVGGGLAVVALALANLRRLFAKITNRTHALAEGDKATPIPLSDRNDELGDIARALEVFRRSALRNDELEAAALAQRAETERAQREAQAAAEREAQSWMETTTRAFAAGLHRLAAGDLAFELRETLADRFEALRSDFNAAVRKLRDTLETVGGAAEAVGGHSALIASSADQLAAAAQRQSSALGETSASVGEIAAHVRATANRAGEARLSVGDTRQRAERADAVMREAIEAMRKIEAASKQIAQINSVVDEIAFQTNLLALNAGVEAARAGEAGRGFAVVAQEVRELALRSTQAAKEIGQLVSATAASIGEGVRQVNGAGEELRAIGESVQKVDVHVQAIADAAQGQSEGLNGVAKTLSELDASTRANADMVSELNAASADLASESKELNSLMSRFQIGGSRAPLAA